jgi:transcriptional regulator with XRE-family HTH domain
MRQILKITRQKTGLKQKEIAIAIGISERMYRAIENGTREGKGVIWDKLEALFDFKIPQRQLRENNIQKNCSTTG